MTASELDHKIREEILQGLRCITSVDPGSVAVEVDLGVVTLKGPVPDRATRLMIEQLAGKQRGVSTIHNEIQVHHRAHDAADDAALARAVIEALGPGARPYS